MEVPAQGSSGQPLDPDTRAVSSELMNLCLQAGISGLCARSPMRYRAACRERRKSEAVLHEYQLDVCTFIDEQRHLSAHEQADSTTEEWPCTGCSRVTASRGAQGVTIERGPHVQTHTSS